MGDSSGDSSVENHWYGARVATRVVRLGDEKRSAGVRKFDDRDRGTGIP